MPPGLTEMDNVPNMDRNPSPPPNFVLYSDWCVFASECHLVVGLWLCFYSPVFHIYCFYCWTFKNRHSKDQIYIPIPLIQPRGGAGGRVKDSGPSVNTIARAGRPALTPSKYFWTVKIFLVINLLLIVCVGEKSGWVMRNLPSSTLESAQHNSCQDVRCPDQVRPQHIFNYWRRKSCKNTQLVLKSVPLTSADQLLINFSPYFPRPFNVFHLRRA